MRLQGKVAYVTGGGRGIGRGIALALAAEGADVAVADVNLADAEAVAAEAQQLGRRAVALKVDVTKWDQVSAMVETTVTQLGGLDIAVNCAGVIGTVLVADMPEAEWDRVMDVNAKGVFLCCKAAIPPLRRSAGKIINIASIAGKDGYPLLGHYCASKFAVVGLTNALAKELAPDGITVNAICPGVVRTYMWDGVLNEAYRQDGETQEDSWQRTIERLVPLQRPQTPEDMGQLAVYICLAPNLTGQAINLDGGFTHH